jgi:hypothetical protein
MIGWCAATFGSAVFLDAKVTGEERVTAEYFKVCTELLGSFILAICIYCESAHVI